MPLSLLLLSLYRWKVSIIWWNVSLQLWCACRWRQNLCRSVMGNGKGDWQWRQHSQHHCDPKWCFISALIQRRNTHSHLHSERHIWKYRSLHIQCKRNRYELVFGFRVTQTDRVGNRPRNTNFIVAINTLLTVPLLKCRYAPAFGFWYGMVWYGMVWYGMVWHGMVWYGIVWFGMVWYGMVWYGVVWYGLVWFGLVWYGMVWYGMVWFGLKKVVLLG